MIDDILELMAELMLGSAVELAGRKTKAAIIGISALLWLAVAVLLLWVGFAKKDIGLLILSAVLLIAFGVWLYIMVKRFRQKKR